MTRTVDNDDGDHEIVSPAALFAIVWDAMAAILGTAAVAAIVRRAAGRAAAERPELIDVVVSREDFEYRYALPLPWLQKDESGVQALRVLILEIGRLLAELTGTVVIRSLEQIPELRAQRLLWRAEVIN